MPTGFGGENGRPAIRIYSRKSCFIRATPLAKKSAGLINNETGEHRIMYSTCLKRLSEANPSFVIRHSTFDIRHSNVVSQEKNEHLKLFNN